ncbi:MAG: hypothetical protein Q9191_000407 [Dirinaria sp. TL-2023a]
MEFDPSTSREPNDKHKDPDLMDTTLDCSANGEQHQDDLEHFKSMAGAVQAEHAEAPAQIQEGGKTSSMAERSGSWVAQVPLRPYLTQDLLSLFGLQSLVASVARTDPVTGEKINKMRKSYEGKVKTFGLAGRNKAVKHEANTQMSLLEMVRWPEEEWHNQKVAGKDVENGLSDATKTKVHKAMQMQPGQVPNNSHWEELLGYEKPKTISLAAETKPKSSSTTGPTGQINGAGTVVSSAAGSEAIRPKRMGRKRRYDDLSFEGYGEGYVDDEIDVGEADGYSSGDGDRRPSIAKKRKKSSKDFGATSPTISDRGGSYGVGMIGVGGYGR